MRPPPRRPGENNFEGRGHLSETPEAPFNIACIPCDQPQMQSILLVLAVLASADCLALRAPTRSGRPCMAAKKRAKQVTRREALSGGGFDSDAAYKDIANAGLREPLLFGGIAVTAAFGLSRRGQLVETLTALDAAQPHKTTGDRLPVTAVAAAKAKFKVEVSGALL